MQDEPKHNGATNSLGPRLAYSVPEVGRMLGMAQSGLWKQIALGKIRVVKIGGRTIITAQELQRLLTEGTH